MFEYDYPREGILKMSYTFTEVGETKADDLVILDTESGTVVSARNCVIIKLGQLSDEDIEKLYNDAVFAEHVGKAIGLPIYTRHFK